MFPENVYSDSRVDISYYVESEEEIIKFVDDILEVESFFLDIFKIRCNYPLSITIEPSVYEFTSRFNLDSKIGALYFDSHAFFQPLNNLKRKGKYRKTLFTEYAHYYIDYITEENCQPWLNEGLSYYYWLIYSNENLIQGIYQADISFLEDFSAYMNDTQKIIDYYYTFTTYLNNLFNEKGGDINSFVLLLRDNDFENAINKL